MSEWGERYYKVRNKGRILFHHVYFYSWRWPPFRHPDLCIYLDVSLGTFKFGMFGQLAQSLTPSKPSIKASCYWPSQCLFSPWFLIHLHLLLLSGFQDHLGIFCQQSWPWVKESPDLCPGGDPGESSLVLSPPGKNWSNENEDNSPPSPISLVGRIC